MDGKRQTQAPAESSVVGLAGTTAEVPTGPWGLGRHPPAKRLLGDE